MSDEQAIAAVTRTLSGLILGALSDPDGGGVPGAVVDTRPLDELSGGGQDALVNLYLYQADVDDALRNADRIDLLPGELGAEPFPLVLHYLITPFVRQDTGLDAHRLLARVVRVLHDNPVLLRGELAAFGPDSNVSQQLDRIRITWQPLGEKDIYSLWSAFQTPYRMSVAYEVRAVLIDSHRDPVTPVPVIKRGRQDEGPTAQGSVGLPFPNLISADPPAGQPAARLGDPITLRGTHLAAGAITVNLTHPLLSAPVPVTVDATMASDTAVPLVLDPATPEVYPAGLWSAGLALTTEVSDGAGGTRPVVTLTNEVPLAVAPRITAMPTSVPRNGDGSVTLDVTYTPPALPGQPVLLIVDGTAVQPDPSSEPGSATFTVPDAAVGPHLVRLRVAGVDSVLIDRSGPKPKFDPTQSVTVT